jgi:anti-sigma-K factor RskA
VYPLVSTTSSQSGESNATGMVYMDPDPNGWGGIIAFRNLSQPPSGQVYQLWMITDDKPTPGPTFMPDADGKALVQVGGDAAGAGAMAITMEPDGGSQTPTTSPVMQGSLTA